jgi:hypothetical protein
MEGNNEIPEITEEERLYKVGLPRTRFFKFYLIFHIILVLLFIFISHQIATLENHNWFDKGTLHFYFSSVFQGFAAILGILIVGMVFYVDKLDQRQSAMMSSLSSSLTIAGLYDEYNSYTKKKSKSLTHLFEFLKSKITSSPPPKNKTIIEDTLQTAINYWSLKRVERHRKNLMFINFCDIIVVIIISGVALLQSSWYLIEFPYLNIFVVAFVTQYAIFAIIGLGNTLYKIFYKSLD